MPLAVSRLSSHPSSHLSSHPSSHPSSPLSSHPSSHLRLLLYSFECRRPNASYHETYGENVTWLQVLLPLPSAAPARPCRC